MSEAAQLERRYRLLTVAVFILEWEAGQVLADSGSKEKRGVTAENLVTIVKDMLNGRAADLHDS
jgi:hypothetical protein